MRLLTAWVAALWLGLFVAVTDSVMASLTRSVAELPWYQTVLPAFSLMAAYSLPMVPFIVLGVWLLEAPVPPAGEQSPERDRIRVSRPFIWPCLALCWVSWLVLTARWGLSVLSSSQSSAVVGFTLALGTIALGLLHCGVALALALGLSKWLGREHWTERAAIGVGSAIAVGAVAALVMVGEPSGAGGMFKMFGVLRREELDLRPLGLVLLWGFGSVLVARSARARSNAPKVIALGALGLALAAIGYRSWHESTAISLRGSAPLSRGMLAAAWRVLDRDRDGQSPAFAGGDCDDANAARFAGAIDQPGNGIDEDCNGADEAATIVEPDKTPSVANDSAKASIQPNLNVLLITIDTLRADLGYMGYHRPVSANLDKLAARSVVFEHSYSLASYTGKSVGPLLIGRYPGETHRNFGHFDKFSKENVFVQQRAQRAGIRTVSVQGYWYFVDEPSGMHRGFDVIDQSAKPPTVHIEGDNTVNSDKISDAALKQLGAVKDQRFFMWVHYVDPHAHYVPHDEFNFGRKGRDLYDGEVAYVDQQVGRVLDFVQQGELNDDTAIIVTSDHGEAFGEHGLYRHGFELWEELIRVPLLIYVPGVASKRERARRGAIDLVPTILELLGLPLPAANADDFLSGQSLVPDLVSPIGTVGAPRPVFADLCAGPYNDERQALIENDMKLITAMGRPVGLYDLAADPGEKTNLLKDEARAAVMKAKLAAFRSKLRVVRPTK